jgi:hypothetical protein
VATWSGWENQLLSKAGLPTTAANRQFLDIWAQQADTNCQNNPIDISHVNTGSFNCKRLTPTRQAQGYATHATAALAFQSEISSGNFPTLFSQLNSGHPFSDATETTVQVGANELAAWGSIGFSKNFPFVYPPHAQPGGGGGSLNIPHAHKGWADLRHSVNVKLPAKLRDSQKLGQSALHQLAKTRKVLK